MALVVILNNEYDVTIASDASNGRDGIGGQIYSKGKLILEIFRDESNKSREVITYDKDVSLEVIEASIELFKKEIPWDFLDQFIVNITRKMKKCGQKLVGFVRASQILAN